MRLGQLARQLSISPEKIVIFLGSREIAIDNHNNARIDDQYVELVLSEFAPGNESLRQQVAHTPDAPESSDQASDEPAETATAEAPAEPTELIKAPKIELPGLRVVGKIELPEKKKPEPPREPDKEAARTSDPRTSTFRGPQLNQPPQDKKNPVALARELEEREKRRKHEEERSLEKQRKTEYYQKRLKPQPPTKPARILREDVEEMPPVQPERPKTLWGRFMRWLNN